MAKKVDAPDLQQLRDWVESHWVTKQQVASLNRRLNEGKERLKTVIQRYGDKDPESGSIFLDLGAPVGERKIHWLKNQRAMSQSINADNAERILKRKKLWDELTATVRVVDQEKVHAAYYDNKLTDEDMDQIFTQHITYSLILLDDNEKPVS